MWRGDVHGVAVPELWHGSRFGGPDRLQGVQLGAVVDTAPVGARDGLVLAGQQGEVPMNVNPEELDWSYFATGHSVCPVCGAQIPVPVDAAFYDWKQGDLECRRCGADLSEWNEESSGAH